MYQSLHTTVIGPGRAAHRDPDPHARDAPRRRARHRRALEVQGAQRRRRRPEGRREVRLAAPAAGVPEGPEGSGRVPREREGRPLRRRGLRLHAQGRRARLPARLDADRLRLRDPLRGRRALLGRARERQHRAAALQAANGDVDRDHDRARTSSRTRTGSTSCVTGARALAHPRATCAPSSASKSINLGRELLEREMRTARPQLHQARSRTSTSSQARRERFGVGTIDELFVGIGYGKLDADRVVEVARTPTTATTTSAPPPQLERRAASSSSSARSPGATTPASRVNGIDDVLVRYAKCCNPLPGDAIIGFITRGRGVTVHRRDCPKAFDTDPERRVDVSWDAQGEDQPPGAAAASRPPTSPASSRPSARPSARRASTSARPTAAPATTAARATSSPSSARISRSSRA